MSLRRSSGRCGLHRLTVGRRSHRRWLPTEESAEDPGLLLALERLEEQEGGLDGPH